MSHAEAGPVSGTARLSITVRAATGSGRTPLAAYDQALLRAGIGNLNLIKLSSVIPPGSEVRVVEDPGGSEESLREQVQRSLGDMDANRGGGYGPVHVASTHAHCTDLPVCALAVAAYTVEDWMPKEGPRG